MTVSLDIDPKRHERQNAARLNRARNLTRAALRRSAFARRKTPNQFSIDIEQRIEHARHLPPEDVDERLAKLVAVAEDIEADTGEIPAVVTDEIEQTAETMTETWDTRDYTYLALLALGRAYDVTRDRTLLDQALAVVHESPTVVGIDPTIAPALEQTAEHPDGHFRTNWVDMRHGQEEIVTPAPDDDPVRTLDPEFDWLYSKDAAHPSSTNTPD